MSKNSQSPSLAALISRASAAAADGANGNGKGGKGRGPAPVEKWNPEHCGALDFVIKRDGTWFYEGTPIGRETLVRLFATVLRKDEDGITYLVTPVEKIAITVEDAHFIAVEMNVRQEKGEPILTFRTNVGDIVEADADHPLRFAIGGKDGKNGNGGKDGQFKPYILVRGRLEALASRAVMYELAEQGREIMLDGVPTFALRSKGAVFPVMPMADLRV